MFQRRARTEKPSRPTSARGSVGSARVWDERTRALRAAPPESTGTHESAATPLDGDELAPLVSAIVQVTLDTRFGDCDPARRARLARELEARLLELLAAAPEGRGDARAAEPAAPVAEPASLPAPSLPAAEPEPVLPEHDLPEHDGMQRALEERLLLLGGPLAARADLRRRLVDLVLQRLTSTPNTGETPPATGAELRDLDVLQRRAAKLERSLQDARAAKAYVSGLEHVDQGIASIYREVQGLPSDDPRRERKRDVLARIFQANLALQKPA